nr:hypothetical protein [Pseudoxanthomonas sp.]
MIKSASVLALFLFAGMAHAGDDFDARVARATKIERSSPVGRAYLMRYMPEAMSTFEKVYGECSSRGTKGTAENFTVVFDIDATGGITNVAVREKEQSAYTKCYVEGITKIKGPPPPESFAKKGFPVVIEETHHIR